MVLRFIKPSGEEVFADWGSLQLPASGEEVRLSGEEFIVRGIKWWTEMRDQDPKRVPQAYLIQMDVFLREPAKPWPTKPEGAPTKLYHAIQVYIPGEDRWEDVGKGFYSQAEHGIREKLKTTKKEGLQFRAVCRLIFDEPLEEEAKP